MGKNKTGLENGYCIDCNACGHSGCCPPTDCKMTNNCSYCSKYLRELKNGYVGCYLLYDLLTKYEATLPEDVLNEFNEIMEQKIDMDTAIGFSKDFLDKYPWLSTTKDDMDT
jgi:hypothetical protein